MKWLALLAALGSACGAVRVWHDSMKLPTYEEGQPSEEAPFPLFAPGEAVRYPYTSRVNFTKERNERDWRALHLENEYLHCIVLPDLGGHLFNCKDKPSGRNLFRAGPSIKKANIGLRGAWVALGIESNFPFSHSWVTVSPVDFATAENADGSASIFVGNTDRVYGMTWRVEFVLKPGVAVLEERVRLYNPSPVRHRYYWWANAAIPIEDQRTRFIYPTRLMATHGTTEIDTWPVNSAGVDMSIKANHKADIALFAYGSKEPWMAVYHPKSRGGTVHYSEASQAAGKKAWSWALGSDQLVKKDLADDDASYVEMQGGLFRDQETLEFLEPSATRRFTEYWMPARNLGGIARADLHGVLNLERKPDGVLVEWDASHVARGARVRVSCGANSVGEETADLEPGKTFTRTWKAACDGKYAVEIKDSGGATLIQHIEDQMDALSTKDVKIGPQPKPEMALETLKNEQEFLEFARGNELMGRAVFARSDYGAALKRFPESAALNKAAGQLAVEQKRFDEAIRFLERAGGDADAAYYLGVARAALGDDAGARKAFEGVAGGPFHAAAQLGLAGVASRGRDPKAALAAVESALSEKPDMQRAGAMQVALLRTLGETKKAEERLAQLRGADPADSLLRYEQTQLGAKDAALWLHLGADPERVLDAAEMYLGLGMYADAIDLLGREYPAPIDSLATEPGAVLPQRHPMVAYTRGYARVKLGQPGKDDFDQASRMDVRYIFPNRTADFAVLQAALKANPADATALYLSGELALASGDVDRAVELWMRARELHPRILWLYGALGRTILELKNDPESALAVYQDGLKLYGRNTSLLKGLRASVEATHPKAEARVEPKRPLVTPTPSKTPGPVAAGSSPDERAAYALDLLLSGRGAEAAQVFTAANFPQEKGSAEVREAYFEVQLQNLVAQARSARTCEAAMKGMELLGDEDRELPFTFRGFKPILKSARTQFYLASVVAACQGEKAARGSWAKIAKSSREVGSADFAWPAIAASRVLPASEARQTLEAALEQVRRADVRAGAGVLAYSEGLLLRALGRNGDAAAKLADAASAGGPTLRYLARAALAGL
jgi:tetratricopeptide (TPR) repeat protein